LPARERTSISGEEARRSHRGSAASATAIGVDHVVEELEQVDHGHREQLDADLGGDRET
jgi:hypothetical protein